MLYEEYEHPLSEDAQFCESGKITLCPDGKYRWFYEYPMLKNPTILITVWKVLLIAALAPAIVVLLSGVSAGFLQAVGQFFAVYGISFGILFVLSFLGYFILAAIYGFKYIVLFEMDNECITHTQQDRQFKKGQAASWLAVLAGIAAGSPETAGAGLLAGSSQRKTSEFKKVVRVVKRRKHHTIKVNQKLSKNQIYVSAEDYDFVCEYISSRCPNAKIQ